MVLAQKKSFFIFIKGDHRTSGSTAEEKTTNDVLIQSLTKKLFINRANKAPEHLLANEGSRYFFWGSLPWGSGRVKKIAHSKMCKDRENNLLFSFKGVISLMDRVRETGIQTKKEQTQVGTSGRDPQSGESGRQASLHGKKGARRSSTGGRRQGQSEGRGLLTGDRASLRGEKERR